MKKLKRIWVRRCKVCYKSEKRNVRREKTVSSVSDE